MIKLRVLLWVIAISQLVLAALVLVMPVTFFAWMGLSKPPLDNQYMLGMLGARFLAYGIGMIYLARMQKPSLFWVLNMAIIQAVDFAVGTFYLSTGVISIETAGFPLFNAAVFGLLLVFWAPLVRE